MSRVFLFNPRKRKSSKRRKTAAKRPRRSAAAARRGSSVLVVRANPRARRRRSAGAVSRFKRRVRRSSFRRNPAALPASLKGILATITNAGIGSAGAIAVDVGMGQVAKVLPVTMQTRYKPDGSANWAYHGVKVGLALVAGIGARYLPPSIRSYVVRGAEGSLVVQSYELARGMIPTDLVTLGYINPAMVSAPQSGMRPQLAPPSSVTQMQPRMAGLTRSSRSAGGISSTMTI